MKNELNKIKNSGNINMNKKQTIDLITLNIDQLDLIMSNIQLTINTLKTGKHIKDCETNLQLLNMVIDGLRSDWITEFEKLTNEKYHY